MSRDLILVAVALITWGVGEGMFYFFQPLYLQQLGADPQQIGNILGAVGAMMALSYLPAGLLSDRFGRRPLMIAAWVIATLATVLLGFAGSLPVFVAGMIIYGMTAFVTVPMNSYVTAARGQWSVGRTITLISASFNLGYIAGPLLGGWIAERSGLQTDFRIAMVFFGVSTVFILMIRPQPVEVHPAAAERGRLRTIFDDRRYLRFIILMFLVMFGLYMSTPLTQNFLQNEHGIDLIRIGTLLSVRSIGLVFLSLVIGQVNARIGLLLSQFNMALFNLLIWLGTGLPAYGVAYFLMGSYAIARGLAVAQGRTLVQSGNMGVAYGMMETFMAVAMVLGPPLAGFLYQRQPGWVYLAGLALVGVGLALNLFFSPVHSKDLQAFEEKEKAEWAGS